VFEPASPLITITDYCVALKDVSVFAQFQTEYFGMRRSKRTSPCVPGQQACSGLAGLDDFIGVGKVGRRRLRMDSSSSTTSNFAN